MVPVPVATEIAQDLVFKTKFDSQIWLAWRKHQSAADVLDDNTIRSRWEAIETKSAAVKSSVLLEELQDQGISDRDREVVKNATKEATEMVAAGCSLFDGTNDESLLVMALRHSALFGIRGDGNRRVVIIYDIKASGEDATNPFQRAAPLRKTHVDRLTRVALEARSSDPDTINPGDVWMFFDDGRPKLISQLQGSLTKCPRTVKLLKLLYDEDDLLERRKVLSAVGQAHHKFRQGCQEEGVHIYTGVGSIQLNWHKDTDYYNVSTTMADRLLPVEVPEILKEGWMMSVAEKAVLMGGGKSAPQVGDTLGEDSSEELEDDRCQTTGSQTDIVPFNFMQMVPDIYAEILDVFGAKAVIDLTASDGVLPLLCLSRGVPYFGICHNTSHVAALTRRLQWKVSGVLAEKRLPLFSAALAEFRAADPGAESEVGIAAGVASGRRNVKANK